jgi:nitrate/TMAO reductase-like tetraheme cytochrome c subunit
VPQVTRRRLALAGLVVLGVLLIGGIGMAGVFKATSTHQFCGSCHIMEPYINAWAGSRHNKIECVECHFPPEFKEALWVKFQASTQLVKWVTQTYSSKPYADVRDSSCGRSGCHATATLDANAPLVFKRVTRFAHGIHLDAGKTGMQLRCTSCHAQVEVGRHFEVAQATCFTCHFKGSRAGRELTPVAGCTGCHPAPGERTRVGGTGTTFDHRPLVQRGVSCQSCHLQAVRGDGDAPVERCVGCHNETDKLARARDLRLVHEAHVTRASIDCVRCHNAITHAVPSRAAAAAPAP